MQITNKDLVIATLALSRLGGQVQVVPENGLSPRVTLKLTNQPFEEAVSKVAKAAKQSWTKYYAILPGGGGGPIAGGVGGPPQGERGPRTPREIPPEARQRIEQVMETMPPEERQKAQERREVMQAVQSLPAEQRDQLMQERMNSPEMQARAQQRSMAGLKNSTPEQRRERYERMYQMRKARESGQMPAGSGRGPR
jgi:hypothetical protein